YFPEPMGLPSSKAKISCQGLGKYNPEEVPFLYELDADGDRINLGPPQPNQQLESVPFMYLPYSRPQDPTQYLARCFPFSASLDGKTYYG
ncbi:MAG: hypothetical protein AAFQ98_22325, partial [Bacteroidota bacterium]